MILKNNVFRLAISLLTIQILAISCNLEHEIAKSFVYEKRISVYILPADYLYKYSLKTDYVDSLGITDEAEREAVLWEKSDFISEINDSLFMANYVLGMHEQLDEFGIEVYGPNRVSEFLQVDTPAFQIHIAQIELEEDFIKTRDGVDVYESHYYHDHYLNALTVHSWFEIVEVNKEQKNLPVLFTTDVITDQVEGQFTFDPFSDQVQYLYNTDSLNLLKIYEYAYDIGRAYGAYSYDYLLNKYLNEQIPSEIKQNKYWRYDPYRKSFFEAGDDRFIPLVSE